MTMLPLGVRSQAMLLVILASIPFALLTWRSAGEQREREHRSLSERAGQLARLIAQRHADTIELARRALAAAAERHAALQGPECASRLALLKAGTPLYAMSVTDAGGRIFCSTSPEAVGMSLAQREYFRQALRTREFAVSGVLRGKINKGNVVVAAHPVAGAGGGIVLVAGVDLDWVPKAMSEAGAPEDFEALILSAKGDVLARYGAISRPGTRQRVNGDAPLPGPNGEQALVRIGLSVGVEPAAADLRRALAVLGGVLALALLIAWLGSGFLVVRPIRRLTDAAAKLDAGDLGARTGIPHHDNEIGHLARRLDVLAAHRQQVSRALRALSAGNRTLLREQTEPDLLRAMCRVAAEQGQYPLAVAYFARHDAARSVVAEAHAGDGRSVLDFLDLTWEDNERGHGTVGSAIRAGRTTVFQSIAREPGSLPWREHLLRCGFGSVASMPLRVEGEVIGTFTLFAHEEDAFNKEELALVQEMADDLAFGIAVCRARVKSAEAEREARFLATHDEHTGLANRSHLLQRMRPVLERASGARESVAVLVVHLRNLPALLEGLGYAPAMRAVREIAQRLRLIVGSAEEVAHLPPDEFVVIAPGTDAEGAATLAHELLAVFDIPVRIAAAQIDVQGHVGTSLYPGHGDEPELLLRRAAIAAREGARRDLAISVYSGATERENPARLALAAELRRAIEGHSLQLFYQPKVNLATGRVVGSEALVRWQHPGKGNIPPGQFVPLAEQTGLIRQLTYLVGESAVRQQRAWLDAGLRLPVAVNLSVRNLYDPRLAERIEGLLATWGVPGELLEIEITEGALVEEPDIARAVLERLRHAGCKIYIDDFGTGYSSLSYLVSLPVHALKIDRSFIVQMTANRQARSVVSSIIGMAHQLGLGVVAEGVERAEERDALIALGCDEAQGYLLGRPVSPETFRASLP